MVERETVKEDGTVVRRCVSAGAHLFGRACDYFAVVFGGLLIFNLLILNECSSNPPKYCYLTL